MRYKTVADLTGHENC